MEILYRSKGYVLSPSAFYTFKEMKLLLADPSTGGTKSVDIEDDYLRKANLGDYRMGQEIEGRIFGDAFNGYVFRISGGQDKDGFPMKQGVMTSSRVRLLLTPGTTGFQKWRARAGERKRRSVRGCILGIDLATVALVVLKKGEKEIEGLTDVSHPLRLGPKRANKIRKLFGLTTQDVRKYVVRRKIPEREKDGKVIRAYSKAPKIQRLIVPAVIRRRNKKLREKKERIAASAEERKAYISLILSQRRDERLRQHNHQTNRKRHLTKKQTTEIRESRQMASEKQRKASAASKIKSKGKK
ncbi:40S ribosomal protein S6 [Perkinsela sp. CCAP 1560/4]|nr:40S ribosomal protein S6 [Perkinsela sp. CCAP 1560/4]|eukprot:KNH09690.1 40S ribosomal protein S6 [Perkinsela sp. CCAP 1560/4]